MKNDVTIEIPIEILRRFPMLRVSTAGPLLRLVERLPRVRRIAEPVAPNVMELLDLYRNNIS